MYEFTYKVWTAHSEKIEITVMAKSQAEAKEKIALYAKIELGYNEPGIVLTALKEALPKTVEVKNGPRIKTEKVKKV